ncbi:MAG: SIR2 family protein [Candidatus Omnitrophica bacterium]|nr:SIR2 family protein [Candidatus Omnitrophota bacterium]
MTVFKKHILLTGAGFTKNFGGFLGQDMWAQIFNNPKIQKHEQLRKLLISNCNFNYEAAYQQVLDNSSLSVDLKSDFTAALIEAYYNMDQSIINNLQVESSRRVDIEKLNEFLVGFSGDRMEKGVIFTLNQDVFIERYYYDHVCIFLHLGLNEPAIGDHIHKNQPLASEEYKIISEKPITEEQKEKHFSQGHSFYIKLHGAFNWKRDDKQHLAIVGFKKKNSIEKHPLFKWYLEIFKEALAQRDQKLLIIGYGFGDDHLNEIIREAIKNSGLKIYIITPLPIAQFKMHLEKQYETNHSLSGKSFAEDVLSGLSGYFTEDLETIFPQRVGARPQIFHDLKKCFW